jgi:AcrR family transcriptional regulator
MAEFARFWKKEIPFDIFFLCHPAPWVDHAIHDVDYENWKRRLNELRDILVERGHFSSVAATQALTNARSESKEKAARWLRNELQFLRKEEQKAGSSPVRRKKLLSRLIIADLAITMLQFLQEAPQENLVCLLQELLDVDRHRRAQVQPESYFDAIRGEARARVLGKRFKVRRLAKRIGVNPSTITRWRKSKEYERDISTLVRSHQEHLESWIAREARNGKTDKAEALRRYVEAYESVADSNREIDWRLSEPSTPWVRDMFARNTLKEREKSLKALVADIRKQGNSKHEDPNIQEVCKLLAAETALEISARKKDPVYLAGLKGLSKESVRPVPHPIPISDGFRRPRQRGRSSN